MNQNESSTVSDEERKRRQIVDMLRQVAREIVHRVAIASDGPSEKSGSDARNSNSSIAADQKS